MSRKHTVDHQAITDGDMSANITSNVTNIMNMDAATYHLFWTGGAGVDGEIIFEASNEQVKDGADVTQWTALDFGTTNDLDDSDTSWIFDLAELNFKWLRCRYAFTAGVGTMQGFLVSKVKGA